MRLHFDRYHIEETEEHNKLNLNELLVNLFVPVKHRISMRLHPDIYYN